MNCRSYDLDSHHRAETFDAQRNEGQLRETKGERSSSGAPAKRLLDRIWDHVQWASPPESQQSFFLI